MNRARDRQLKPRRAVMSEPKPQTVSRRIQDFLDSLAWQQTNGPVDLSQQAMWVVNQIASFTLARHEWRQLNDIERWLRRTGTFEARLGKSEIRRILTEAIARCKPPSNGTVSIRTAAIAAEATRALLDPPETRAVYFPVHGLIIERPVHLGNVRLFPGGPELVGALSSALDGYSCHSVGSDREMRRALLRQTLQEAFEGVPVPAAALVTVAAGTTPAVIAAAQRDLSQMVAILYLALFLRRHPLHQLLVSPWRQARDTTTFIVVDADGLSYSPIRGGPLGYGEVNDDLVRLMDETGLSRLSQPRDTLSAFEKTLLTCAYWISNALQVSTTSQAFIAYFTALEALFVEEGRRGAVTDRICERVAHTLGGTVEECQAAEADVRGLYILRGRVIHAGYADVPEVDVQTIQAITIGCFFELLRVSARHRISDALQLATYFSTLRYSRPPS